VEIFEKQKYFFLFSRKKSLTIFLEKLLNHSELKYTDEIYSFLMDGNDKFNLERDTKQKYRNE
jgi:hypothetical protein